MNAVDNGIKLEIEAKFAIPGEQVLRRLRAVPTLAGMRLGRAATVVVIDTYLDTETGAVSAGSYAWRRRAQGGRITTTLKRLMPAADGVHRREELEVEADGHPSTWPEGVTRDCALRLVGDAPLLPLATVSQQRSVRTIRSGPRLVAMLSLDTVNAQSGNRVEMYRQAEVELAKEGTDDDMAALVAVLRDEWKLPAETRSKLERAVALLPVAFLDDGERAACRMLAARNDLHGRRARALLAMDAGETQAAAGRAAGMSERRVRYWRGAFRTRRLQVFPRRLLPSESSVLPPRPARHAVLPALASDAVRLTPATPMAEAACRTLARQFSRMLAHEPGTRAGEDPEELHDMRVATRRMRAALDIFAGALEPSRVRPVRKGLRRVGRALGAVRDLDVFWLKTARYLDDLPPDRSGELEPLRAAWSAEREAARQRLLDHLDGPRHARFLAACEEFLQRPDMSARPPWAPDGSPVPRRVGHVLPAIVYARVAAVRAFDEWVGDSGVPLPRLHRLRIAAKALRYTIEFFQELLGPEAASVVDEMKDLQDHLGELQDTVVAMTVLRDFLTWGTWRHEEDARVPPDPVLAPGVATYLAVRQRELAALLETFTKRWREIQRSDFVARIAAALAFVERGEPDAAV